MFNTMKAAEAYAVKAESILTDANMGKTDAAQIFSQPAGKAAPAPTFGQAVERWWALEGASFKGGTRDTYQNILALHILPRFKGRDLTSITATDMEDWWAGIRARKLSHDHSINIRSVMVGVLRRAVKSRLIPSNPADAILGRLGREDREVRQAEWLTEPELIRALAVAEAREPRYYPAILTIASTGLRMGELVGLQVGDVDLDRCRLSVRRRIRKREISSPKSGKARTVDVPPSTIAVLRDWINTVRAEAAVRGHEALWLFPSKTGTPIEEPLLRDAWKRVLTVAEILRLVRVHDLRHTYASLALQRGVPLLVVSRQLGHSSIGVTGDVYGHLLPDATREAATAWEAILNANSRNSRATVPPESS
ncbi:MAG TPA: tyrosine-type recombinase/integrase [Candidatus Methylomirabilis sp.]|nr:tyrosine-type recombinase/integrase [Candidatus Methylomirabilis sp.]